MVLYTIRTIVSEKKIYKWAYYYYLDGHALLLQKSDCILTSPLPLMFTFSVLQKSEESRKALLSLRPGQRRSSAPQVAPRVPALSRVQRAREQRLKSQSSGAIEAAALQAQKSLELEQAIARDVREDREQHLRQSASSQNPTRDTGALLPSSPPPLPTSSRMGRSTPLPALGSQGSQDDGASAAAVTLGAVKLPDPRRTQPGHRLQPLPAATSSVKPQTKKPPSTPGHLRKKT